LLIFSGVHCAETATEETIDFSWIPAFAGMTTHKGCFIFSKSALLFRSSQVGIGNRALTEASAAKMLMLRLQECIYDVFSECTVSGGSEETFGTLI
jgi:hypothetical protein